MGNTNLVLKKVLFQLFLICSPLKSLQEQTFIKKKCYLFAIFLRSSISMNKEYKNIVLLNRTLLLVPKSRKQKQLLYQDIFNNRQITRLFCDLRKRILSKTYFFWQKKNGQNMAQTFRKWHKIIQICENSGERKIFPSANPAAIYIIIVYTRVSKTYPRWKNLGKRCGALL